MTPTSSPLRQATVRSGSRRGRERPFRLPRSGRLPLSFAGLLAGLLAGILTGPARAQERDAPILSTEALFVLTGSPEVPFRQPTDVAVGPEGRIYVMDGVNSRVAVFSSAGTYRYSFGSPGEGPGEMRMPVGIGVSPSGEVYVADSGNHRIQVFGPTGAFVRAFGLTTGEKGDPTDVLPARLKNFCYVVDNDSHQVHLHDGTTGSHVKTWGEHGKNIGEFRYPATIAADGHNHVYVVDVMNARVQTFDPYGNNAREISGWGVKAGKVFRPKGVTLDKDERIYVTDSYMGIVQVFRKRGELIGILGDPEGKILKLSGPTNVTLDREGRLFVVETRASRVSTFRIVR